MYPEPSAPSFFELIGDNLMEPRIVEVQNTLERSYNAEAGCDVEFLVGDPDLVRIPAHSCMLKEYPYFKALLSDHFAAEYVYYMDRMTGLQRKLRRIKVHMDWRAFDNLLRFIYQEPIVFQSTDIAIETLKVAQLYLVHGLVRFCSKRICQLLSENNVLFVYANVRFLCNGIDDIDECLDNDKNSRRKKSKEVDDSFAQDDGFKYMKKYLVRVLSQCVDFIDTHGGIVLESKDLEYLERSHLHFLLKRDSIAASESTVFSAILRWAETECKRQHLHLTKENKRLVLNDLLYIVRYTQMSPDEFAAGPVTSGLLLPEEIDFIGNMLRKSTRKRKNLKKVGRKFGIEDHLDYLNKPRTNQAGRKFLSSSPKEATTSKQVSTGKALPSILKRRVKASTEDVDISPPSKKRYSTWADKVLRVFVFLFD